MRYILLFLILSFSILAQNMDTPSKNPDEAVKESNDEMTQQRIREMKKYEIGGGVNGLKQKLPFIRFGYNISSRFSIGYTHFHKREESSEPFLFYPVQNINISLSGITNSNSNASSKFSTIERNNSIELGLFHLRYYIWEKVPFYVTSGFGRDFVGSKTSITFHGDIFPNGGFRANPSYVWTGDIKPYYLYFVGLGFQWVFENGLFVGYEILRLQAINQRTNNYTINYQANMYENAFLSFVDKGLSRQTSSTFQLNNFWIGYSFSL